MTTERLSGYTANSSVGTPALGKQWSYTVVEAFVCLFDGVVMDFQVRSDPSVTWLACWTENVQGQTKYVMLNAASKLKGEKDWQKYETARKLHKCVDKIREQYRLDWKSKEMRIRQRAVALYFIDKVRHKLSIQKFTFTTYLLLVNFCKSICFKFSLVAATSLLMQEVKIRAVP